MLNEEPVNYTNAKSIGQIIKHSCDTRYLRWHHNEVEEILFLYKGHAQVPGENVRKLIMLYKSLQSHTRRRGQR